MTESKRPGWFGELGRSAGHLLSDVGSKVTETARRAHESEQLQQWVSKANETAGYLEKRARELEPVAREKAGQAIVELQSASRSATGWMREKLEEAATKPQSPDESLHPEKRFGPDTKNKNH